MKRIINALLLISIFFAFSINCYAAEKIADISSITGEVRIKSQERTPAGKWLRVKKTSVRLFNNDEVRTLSGTAEIIFTDGSVVRVSENTSFIIEEKASKKNFFGFKKAINRNIKIFAGSLWAKIKPSKGRWTSFESKSAVAGIKGTTITVGVDASGKMNFATLSGSASVAINTANKGGTASIVDVPADTAVAISGGGSGKSTITSTKGVNKITSGNTVVTVKAGQSVDLTPAIGGSVVFSVPAGSPSVTIQVAGQIVTVKPGESITVTKDGNSYVPTPGSPTPEAVPDPAPPAPVDPVDPGTAGPAPALGPAPDPLPTPTPTPPVREDPCASCI